MAPKNPTPVDTQKYLALEGPKAIFILNHLINTSVLKPENVDAALVEMDSTKLALEEEQKLLNLRMQAFGFAVPENNGSPQPQPVTATNRVAGRRRGRPAMSKSGKTSKEVAATRQLQGRYINLIRTASFRDKKKLQSIARDKKNGGGVPAALAWAEKNMKSATTH